MRATKNLVDGMTAAPDGPKVLVSQSAVGYYGDRGEAMIDESTPPREDSFLSKLVSRVGGRRAGGAKQPEIRVVITRTGLVLDPEGGLLKQLLLPFKLGVGGPLAGGDWYMPWIHRDDEVGLFLWAIENASVDGGAERAAPEPGDEPRVLEGRSARCCAGPSFAPAPKLALRALRGAELADAILRSLRVVPRRALDLGYEFRWPELEPALRDLLRKPSP